MEEKPNYSTKAKTIFRTIKNEDHPFVMIDRRPVENPELSWGAKGVLSYLLSRPDNWTVRLRDLVNRSTDGTSKIRGYITELVKAGHVHRVAHKEPKTHRIYEWVLEVYELPFTQQKATPPVSMGVESHSVENRTLNDNDTVNDNDVKPPVSKKPKKDIVDGMIDYQLKPQAIRKAFSDFFKLTPNWEAKYNRQFLEWLAEKEVTAEQIQTAARIWGSDRRFNWKHPDLRGIQEHWLELVEQPTYQDEYHDL